MRESNTYFEPVIALSTGGNGHEFPKVKVVKTDIDAVTCKMMEGNFGAIHESRKDYARLHLRIFHDLPQREMKQRSFFLMLNRSSDGKVMEIDYVGTQTMATTLSHAPWWTQQQRRTQMRPTHTS